MSQSQRDLERRAAAFAGGTAALLNRTVTDGIRLDCGSNDRGQAIVGYKLGRVDRRGEAIPLTISRSPAKLFLRVFWALRMDDENLHLASVKSTYGLCVGDESAFAYHYERDPGNDYPVAHLHIDGDAERLQRMLDAVGRGKDRPTALHLPVGGSRHQPSLEDVIEFCIVERLVNARDGWEQQLRASRQGFQAQQLRAAVRNDPRAAAETLRNLGWAVEAP